MSERITYSDELAREICDTIASEGKGLKRLCKENPHWPSYNTIYKWLRQHPIFSDLYAYSKKEQVTCLVDEILDIADDGSQDEIIDNDGNVRQNSEFINRSRIRIDTRKWIATKLVPRLYGDNSGMRELYEEIAELKRELAAKGVAKDGEINSSKTQQDSEK